MRDVRDDDGTDLPARGRRVALLALLDEPMTHGEGTAMDFTSVKVFSATKARDREVLGETVTEWLRDPAQAGVEVVRHEVTQSSDSAFHCLAVTLFYRRPLDTIRSEMATAAKVARDSENARLMADGAESLKPRRVRRNGGAA